MYNSFPFLYYKFLSIQKIFKYIKQRCKRENREFRDNFHQFIFKSLWQKITVKNYSLETNDKLLEKSLQNF